MIQSRYNDTDTMIENHRDTLPAIVQPMVPVTNSISFGGSTRDLQNVLQTQTLEDFLHNRPPCAVFSVTPETNVWQLSKLLAVHRVLSAPVLTQQGHYQGFVDMLDVLPAIIELMNTHPSPPSEQLGNANTTLFSVVEQFTSLNATQKRSMYLTKPTPKHQIKTGERLETISIASLQRSDDGQAIHLQPNTTTPLSLLDVIRQGFINPVNKLWCHRLAVLDSAATATDSNNNNTSKIIAIFSQSDVLRLIYRQRYHVPGLMARTLRQLSFLPKPATVIPHDMPAVSAFESMLQQTVNAVAVMDQHGRLVATLSASDLRVLHGSQFELLRLPVVEFIRQQQTEAAATTHTPGSLASEYGVTRRGRAAATTTTGTNTGLGSNGNGSGGGDLPAVAACSMDTKLEDVLRLFVSRGVHRVWIVEGDGSSGSGGVLKGLVSTSDVLTALCAW